MAANQSEIAAFSTATNGDHDSRILLADSGLSSTSPCTDTGKQKHNTDRNLMKGFYHLLFWRLPSKRNLGLYFWVGVYLTANVVAFTSQASKFANNKEAQNLLGLSVVISRGAANCLNLNCALILLPISRSLVTRLTVSRMIPNTLPCMTDIHKWLGIAILFWTVIHCAGHVCNLHQIAHADRDAIYAMLGDRLFGANNIPDGATQRWKAVLFQTRAGVTGITMLICMAVAYPLLSYRRKHFESFWFSHHLLIIMLFLLCFHGTGNIVEKHQSIYWLSVPLLLYLIPRLWDGISNNNNATRVLSAHVHDSGEILCLRLSKPRNWRSDVHKAGMYACLQVPAIGRYEWHPFTMTSCPEDPYLEFHIKKLGNFTASLIERAEHLCRLPPAAVLCRGRDLTVRVDGPFAASTTVPDCPIIALVCAGIGVTPALSILKSLLQERANNPPQRLYLYWTLRDHKVPEWFLDNLNAVLGTTKSRHLLHTRFFLTQADSTVNYAIKLHPKDRPQEVYGRRPHWGNELSRLELEAECLGHRKCAVLFCGPAVISKTLEEEMEAKEAGGSSFYFHLIKETSF